jgi:hypothetical protein
MWKMKVEPGEERGGALASRLPSWRPSLLAAAGALGVYALFQLLSRLPALAELVFAGIDALVTRPLSIVTGLVPFAVVELLVAAYVFWIGALSIITLRALRGGRRGWPNALAAGGQRILRDAAILVIFFYGAWGLNYARPVFAAQAGWPEWSGIDVEEVTALAEEAVAAANTAYLELHGTPDAGKPTGLADARALEAAIDAGWFRATELLELPPNAAARYGAVKRPWSSELLLRLGISGIYSPFTAEANVPRGLPAISVPTTMAHEKAHQRGFTSEADAGFLGFVVSGLAPDPLGRYAAALYAQSQLLRPLYDAAPDRVDRLVEARLPGVERDLAARRDFYARYDGTLNEVGSRVNDRYLTTNRVAAGVGDYRRSAWLIVEFSRQNGGSAMPSALD